METNPAVTFSGFLFLIPGKSKFQYDMNVLCS